MDAILAVTIGVLAVAGIGIAFTSGSDTESPIDSNQELDSNEVPPLTGNPYQDTRIVGGKRRKKKKSRRKGQ